jgi:hypothetical protein
MSKTKDFPTLTYAEVDPDEVEVVDEDQAAAIRRTPSWQPPVHEPAEHIQRLRDGAMLFIPGPGHTSWHARMSDWPARHGFRVRQRRAERNGTWGHYVWLEAIGVGQHRQPRKQSKEGARA